MKVQYFQETDKLYIELRPNEAVETRHLDENTTLDLDESGNICGITIEHARERTGVPRICFRAGGGVAWRIKVALVRQRIEDHVAMSCGTSANLVIS